MFQLVLGQKDEIEGLGSFDDDFVVSSRKTFDKAKNDAEGYIEQMSKNDAASTTHVYILTPKGEKIFPPFVY